ncbi:hypothetical protein QTO34_014159 [Cnephaeus nilssonii]|uniref:C2H2-type domain-containing protein n=1 Tax=Cnephaeus nilssonii TaxID=3371016 RepID=A0AA40HA20_CNENI|nr:hypothetical protein QTO34_014159 [Eptesicus nilssonii]
MLEVFAFVSSVGPNSFYNQVHTGEKLYECRDCRMSFIQSSTITPHQRVHTGENLRSVVNVGKLLPTIITSLSTGEFTLEKSLEHNDCLPSYNTTEFTVEKSPKSVVTVGSSLGNARVHSGAKPYECSECGKSFTCNNHLLIHKRVHIGEKLYVCTVYGKFVIFINIRGVNTRILFVNDFHGFEDSVEVVIKNVVELSKQLDLEVEAEDVTELLASHGEELSAEDLTQLKQQFIEEEDTPTPEPRRFTSRN